MKKVLIVDDSRFWRLILENLLTKNGYNVITADNAMQAVDLALKEYPDAIISDYNMPGVSGLQLCLYIRSVSAFQNAGIAILTGSDDVINEFWARNSGANRFISKLLPKEELEKTILEFLNQDFRSDKASKNVMFNSIYDVLEQKMRMEILNREVLSLVQFARDEYYVVKELKNFFSNFTSFESCAFLILSPVEGRIYNFGIQLQRNVLKDKLLKILEKPLEPSNWSFFGTYGLETSLNDVFYHTIKYDGNEIGAIALYKILEPRNLVKVFNDAKESISLLFNTLNTFRELKVASTVDGLTGLFNKKELLRFLEETHSLFKKSDKTYFVAMIDIDDFKKINDTYGHLVGDETLRLVGKILREMVSEKGIAGRYGGEEFTVVLTKTTKDEVVDIIENILQKIRTTEFPYGRCTVSAGVVSSNDFQSPTEVLKAADELLYIAKKSGKDKAVYMLLPSQEEFESIIQAEHRGQT
ncbi:MAG: diguanylate cyclase [Fervidobacterium sp.]|nr:diguanylate cyclase [Fervidobacterium sp.]